MAIANCPKCATKLKVPDGVTASVRCPKCQTVFKANAPAPAAPAFEVVDAPPPPKPASKPAAAARPAAPAPKPAAESNPFTNLDDKPKKKASRTDDDDDEDDRPRRKRRDDDEDDDDRPRSKKRSRDDDDEDDDRPRSKKRSRDDDDDDDDRPRKKRRDDDDEDDDDRPKKKRKAERDDTDYSPPGKGSKFGIARTSVLLLLISLGLYAGSLSLQLLCILIAFIGGVIPSAMGLITGILGLVNWVLGLVGLGMCIAGPSRARGLAIAAVSVAAVHLILCFITVNDSDSAGANIAVPILSSLNRASNALSLQKELQKEAEKNPGSARAKELREEIKSMREDGGDEAGVLLGVKSSRSKMRWADLTTQLTFSDKLIALICYQSKNFSNALLGIFSGLTELARLILIALMLGSLGRAAKSDSAISKGKLGWIVAASAGGAAMLVMLLAFVIADNTKLEAKDLQPNTPPMPNMQGKSIQEVQRAMEDHRKQVQAEFDRLREKQESAFRAPFRWLAVGELLVLVLHVGSVAMPVLAAMAIFSATGSGRRPSPGKRYRRPRDDDDDD